MSWEAQLSGGLSLKKCGKLVESNLFVSICRIIEGVLEEWILLLVLQGSLFIARGVRGIANAWIGNA